MPKLLSQTKHYKVTRKLRQYASKLQPGEQMPTAAELQRLTRASHGTIIRALSTLSADGVLYRPTGKMRYVVRPLAERHLVKLCFISHDYPSNQVSDFQSSLYKICKDKNWRFERKTFSDINNFDFNQLAEGSDAVIFLPPSEDFPPRLVRTLQKPNQPTVLLMQHTDIEDIGNIAIDDEACGRLAVKTLAELGHRRIMLMNDQPRESTIRAREMGWRKEMKAQFGAAPKELIFNTGIKSYESAINVAYTAFTKYLKKHGNKHFSAIFPTSLEGAIAASRCLREAGIKIPEEVSVIAFAGESPLCDFLYPALTNIAAPIDKYCSTAIEVIENMLKDPMYKQKKILLPVHLNQGDSTMPYKAK